MSQTKLSRRDWLGAGLIGSCGALSALSPLQKQAEADEARGKPSSLTITKVETFSLEHKLPKAIGPSVAQADTRDTLLVKISTDSGLVGWGETADVGGTRHHRGASQKRAAWQEPAGTSQAVASDVGSQLR